MALDPAARAAVAAFLADPSAAEAELARALTAAESPRQAAWRLAESAGRLLQLHDCVIYLREPNSERLRQLAAWGHKQIAPGIVEHPIGLSIGQGIVGACARDLVSVLVADTQLDHRYVLDDQPRRSELAVPIVAGGRLLGVIDSEHPEPDAFNSLHIRALLALAAVYGRCRGGDRPH